MHKFSTGLSGLASKLRSSKWVNAPVEAILHASPGRMRIAGFYALLGQPLCALVWSSAEPQAYESVTLRLLLAILGFAMIWKRVSDNPNSVLAAKVATVFFWIELPLFFFWMYFCNGGSTEWLVTLCCMVLIYYHVTDWRIATIGTMVGCAVAWALHSAFIDVLPSVPKPAYLNHALLFAFCWLTAMTLGVSSANLRHEHFETTLHAMQILVQEMRGPMSTVGAIAKKMAWSETEGKGLSDIRETSDRLGSRLYDLIRLVHSRLDTNLFNAGMTRVLDSGQRVSAYEVLNEVVGRYPYASPKARACVTLTVEKDFEFQSSFGHFAQAIDNILNNSFRALEHRGKPFANGDITIVVSRSSTTGIITIRDLGEGIKPHILGRVFEPFFSTHGQSGLGLGLNFTKKVIDLAGGKVIIDSVVNEGTLVTLQVPIMRSKQRTAAAPSDALAS
jgi:two-component system CAI-1 autoinducer sensor kinase/phosphatase CqsS